jgi:hypothetical protein
MSGFLGEVDLRADERILRPDMVWFFLSSTAGFYPNPPTRRGFLGSPLLARMIVTTERITWLPPREVPGWYRIAPFLLMLTLSLVRRFAPLSRRDDIALTSVTHLWKWHPEFSGSPIVQAGEEGWTLQLLEDRRPWNKVASKEETREHFEAVEAAWKAARSYHP